MSLEVSDNWATLEGAPPTWIPLLPRFTGTPWRDRAEYSAAGAGWVVRALGSRLAAGERQSLDLVPLPVFLNIWKSADDKDTVLHGLAGADAPGVVRPPSIENVSTGHLGSGLRVYRVTRPDPDSPELLGIIAYAFRCEEYATDIHLQAVSYDLGFLQACLDGLDEFAGCIVCTRSPDVMET